MQLFQICNLKKYEIISKGKHSAALEIPLSSLRKKFENYADKKTLIKNMVGKFFNFLKTN